MVNTHTIPDFLTGNEVSEALLLWISEIFEDFSEVQAQYRQAVQDLQKALRTEQLSSVMDAVATQTSSNFLFSVALGLKANLDNFTDPVGRYFLDVDSEVYLRENTAHHLPKYVQAQNVLDYFYISLNSEQKEMYDSIIAYCSYLETVVPKLGHYYGYILGNRLLPLIVPGYHEDPMLNIRYRMLLKDYWGKRVKLPAE